MGLSSRPSRHHVGAALLGAIVIGAALAPTAALADNADPEVAGCPDPLSVISWNGAEDAGDPRAVAITAQLLDADTEGWSSASWQAAAGTTLTAVTAIRIDGGVAALAAEPTGTASDIVALAFCGTTQTTAAPPETVDHESAGDPPPAPVTVAPCEDLLSVATPERVEGSPRAVAITAQALDLGEPGWSNIGWEPAAGTRLRAVFVTGTDGTVTDAGEATSATDVASLHFCGTVDRSTSEVLPASPTGPVVTPTTPDAPTTSTSGAPSETLRPAVREPTAEAPEADLPIVAAGTPEAPAGDVVDADAIATEPDATEPDGTEPDGTDITDGTDTGNDDTDNDDTVPNQTENDDIANHETEEVEVLGIQLTREDEPSGSGPLGTGVAPFAVLAVLATAGGVLWSRHS